MSDRYVVLSGCSGGGKSSLLSELKRRGHSVIDEPGRRVVKAELEATGHALPWVNLAAFARRAIEISIGDHNDAGALPGWVFFDRGLIDAAVALEHATSELALGTLGKSHRYNETIFLTPPWPEIYVSDPERRHGLEDAISEYKRLQLAYPRLGYRVVELPKASVKARADFILAELSSLNRHGKS
jgi:predicted ATPase